MPSPLANPYSVGQLNDLVKIGLVAWHKGAEMALESITPVRNLFFEKRAQERSEEHSEFNESGFSSRTGDGEDYKLVTDTQGDTLTLTQVKRTARRIITEELIDDNKYDQVAMVLRKTGGKLWRGYALDLTHRLTFAMDTSYTDRDGETVATIGGDAAAMVADTHTTNSGGTYDNKLTAAISETAIESAIDLGNAFVDHNGQLVAPNFDTIVTGTKASVVAFAKRFVGQGAQPDTTDRNDNIYRGLYKHVVLPYLDTTGAGAKDSTKSTYWFLVDSSLAKGDAQLISSIKRDPRPEAPTVDPDNNNVQFKGSMRYDIGHLTPQFVVGSTGAS